MSYHTIVCITDFFSYTTVILNAFIILDALCQRLLGIANGKIVGNNTYGSYVRYSCNDGYELVGSSSRKCLSDKRWSGRAPSCKLKSKLQSFISQITNWAKHLLAVVPMSKSV